MPARSFRWKPGFLAGVGLFVAVPATSWSQDSIATVVRAGADQLFDLVPVVTAASRFAQGTGEAPASISIITGEEIRRFGYRTVADVLTSVRGIYSSNDRNYTYLGLRGFAETGNYNSRTLVLLDGHRLNEPLADAAYFGLESAIAIEDIERVEVIRGPGSSLYGTNALLGVINIVSRRTDWRGMRVGVEAGSLGTYRGRAAWSGRVGSARIQTSGSLIRSDGATLTFPEFSSPSLPGGRVVDSDGERNATMLTKVEAGDWTAAVGFGHRRKQIPTGSYLSIPGDPATYTVDWRAFGFLRYETVRPNRDRVTVKVGVDGDGYNGSFAYTDGIIRDYQRSRWLSLEGQYLHAIGHRHRILVGGEIRYNARLDQGVTSGTSPIFEDRRNSAIAAGFVQDEIRLGRMVLVNLGVRHDRYEVFGGTTNPRAAVIINPVGKTTIKALAGRAFRAPSAYELYYHDGSVTQKPAVTLAPERLNSLELIGEQQIGRRARVTVSGYRIRFDNAIALATDTADALLVYQNVGAANGSGIELEAASSVGPGIDIRAAYAYQRVTDRTSGADLPNTPRHLLRIGASAPIGRTGLAISGEIRSIGARWRSAAARVPGYALANAAFVFSRSARFEWGLSIFNLFDRRYGDPGGDEHTQTAIPQDGRTVRVRAGVRF